MGRNLLVLERLGFARGVLGQFEDFRRADGDGTRLGSRAPGGASAGTPLGASSGPWVYTDTWSRY